MNDNIIKYISMVIGGTIGLFSINYIFYNNDYDMNDNDINDNDISDNDINNNINKETNLSKIENNILNNNSYEYDYYIDIDSDDDDKKNIQNVIKGKKLAYNILLSSMYKYLKHNTNHDFDEFLKKEWKEDYDIMIKSEENSSIKRDYTHWKTMFYHLKKKYNL